MPFAGELTQRSEINPQAGVLAALPQSLDLTQEGGARDVHRAGRLRNGLLPEPHRKVTQFRRQGGQHPVEIEGQIGTLRAARPVTVGDVGGRLVPGEPGVQRPDADLQPLDRQPVASDEQFGAGGTATC